MAYRTTNPAVERAAKRVAERKARVARLERERAGEPAPEGMSTCCCVCERGLPKPMPRDYAVCSDCEVE